MKQNKKVSKQIKFNLWLSIIMVAAFLMVGFSIMSIRPVYWYLIITGAFIFLVVAVVHYEYFEKPIETCILDNIENVQRDDEPPVVLNKRSGFLENYYITIITILAQLGEVKSAFLKPLGYDLEYDSNWAVGKPQNISIPSDLDELKESSYKFFIELQKVFGFLEGQSKRSFISGDNLIVNLPNDIKKRLVNNRIETVDELLPKLYESLQNNYDNMFGHEVVVDRLFKSSVESVNE